MSRFALPASPRSSAVPLIRATEVAPFVAWLDTEGIPKHGFLQRAGLPADPTQDPQEFVAGLPYCEFLADVAEREAGPGLGWRVAAGTDPTQIAAFERALSEATSLGSALHAFCLELRWDSPTADFGLLETRSGAWFWRRPGPGVAREIMEQFVASMMVRIVRALAGPDWWPLRVKLMADRVDPVARPLLGDPVCELGAGLTAVHLEPSLLALPVPAGPRPPALLSGPESAADLVGALRLALRGAVASSPGVDWGAAATGLSRRTFQRRLAQRGLTWALLLDQVRREVACRELAVSPRSVYDVARRTGYGDPANFTRAFRRWTGSTPQAYREGARRPESRAS